MKKLFTLIALIVSINGLNAQNINFPDANFKALLLSPSNTVLDVNSTSHVICSGIQNDNSPITLDANSDGEISIQEAQAVYYLSICNSNLTDLTGIENFTNLISLVCNNNQITTLNVSNQINLEKLQVSYTNITSINLSNNTKLKTLDCSGVPLTNLDLSNNPLLQNIACTSNNLISSLNVSNLTELEMLDFAYTQISTIDVSNNLKLSSLWSENTQLSSLDISKNKLLIMVYLNGNSFLNSLNLKNGKIFFLQFNQTPNLKYICIDDIQKDTVFASIATYNYSNVEVNTYCSFTPGGDHNTISGNIIYDFNNNGCDVNDPKNISYTKVKFLEGSNSGITFSDTYGVYNFYTPKGTFLITPSIEDTTIFSFSPPNSSITFIDSLNHITTQDFCIYPIGAHSDVEVVLNPIRRARPGFDAHYQLVYKNKGNQTLSGTINLLFNDSLIDFLSSSVAPISSSVGNLTWDYSTLLPFEVKTINLTFNVNSPAEIPAVNIGDTLNFIATITPIVGDVKPLDNIFNFNQIVVGAYDPNVVTCLEGDIIPSSSIGQYLHYTIDFENTGNFPAENIVVKEIIDPKKFDIKTLQILNSSNKVYTRIKDNQIEYIFEGIQLEEHNHGNILFKLKTRDTLTLGDSVLKSADIYFDYNLPVQTNNAKTTFQNLTAGLDEIMIDQTISVFPNPSIGVYNIRTENQTKQVEVFDASGRLILMKIGADNSSKVDITNQEQGIYFLKITTDKGVKVMEVSKN